MPEKHQIEMDCIQCLDLLIHGWGHGFSNRASSINDQVDVMRKQIRKTPLNIKRIENLLDRIEEETSHIKDYQSPFHVETVDLNDLLESRIETWQKDSLAYGIEIIGEMDDHSLKIWANGQWIRRIADNLVDNAVEALKTYNPIGQGTQKSEKKITIRTGKDGSWAFMSMADNGPGIPQEKINALFKRSQDLRPGGRGRGLHLVSLLVEIYKGKIDVPTVNDNGAIIIIHLPLIE